MDVTLTNVEISLFDSIDFDPAQSALDDGRRAENDEVARILTYSLLSRDCVPVHRLGLFDTENRGDAAMAEGDAPDDAARIDALVRHPEFLGYLRYFICGPELPPELVKAFRREMKTAAGDQRRLTAKVIEMARRLETPSASAGDFHRLALECRLAPAAARDLAAAVAAL